MSGLTQRLGHIVATSISYVRSPTPVEVVRQSTMKGRLWPVR